MDRSDAKSVASWLAHRIGQGDYAELKKVITFIPFRIFDIFRTEFQTLQDFTYWTKSKTRSEHKLQASFVAGVSGCYLFGVVILSIRSAAYSDLWDSSG